MARPDRPRFVTLHAFVVAARHQSIRQAAEELGVTASAVSHQIRALEDWIGAAVFVREPRRIRPTPLGKRLFRQMSGGFASIENHQGVNAARNPAFHRVADRLHSGPPQPPRRLLRRQDRVADLDGAAPGRDGVRPAWPVADQGCDLRHDVAARVPDDEPAMAGE
ncbi:MAG: LysR family transcriptional regulator, partial [Gammaproteobacteria bacterium]|nr:LysR family transcriptional regulator [Gammaproteobacteria bacterium]